MSSESSPAGAPPVVEEEASKPKLSRQTIAGQKYKEEGTQFFKEKKFGKAITKYQLCRMNTLQAAQSKTKAEVAQQKVESERRAEARRAAAEQKRIAEGGDPNAAPVKPQMDPRAQEMLGKKLPNGKTVTPEMLEKAAAMAQQMQDQQLDEAEAGGGDDAAGQNPMDALAAFGGAGGNYPDEEIELSRTLYLASLNNLAMCYLLKEPEPDCKRAIEVATEAIKFDPACAKSFFRRGVAHVQRGDPSKGVADLATALGLAKGEAEKKDIEGKLAWAKQHIEMEKKKEKAVYNKMFA